MISPPELLAIKARLVTAAEAAFQIATSADPVRYDQESYEAAYIAMVSMKEDVTAVLAELDVLRGVVYSGVEMFLKEESDGGLQKSGGDVAPVPVATAGEGGGGEHAEPAGADGRVPEGGVPGKRTKRSKPRRNKKSDAATAEPVGSGDGAAPVDSSTNA